MGIQIHRKIPDDSLIVQADPAQLRQVLLNLLLNALEASPENGSVDVSLTYEPLCETSAGSSSSAPSGGHLRIDIEDDGSGLPPHLADKIFDPFITTKDSGTGLGLAICKRIVDDHGGEIFAENCPTRGARFTVRLPMEIAIGEGRPVWESQDTST